MISKTKALAKDLGLKMFLKIDVMGVSRTSLKSDYFGISKIRQIQAIESSIGLAFSLQLTKRSVSHPSTGVLQERL
jgi:hypothetical protein